jgi:ribonuclease HI
MNTPKLDGICVLVDGGCLNNNKPVSERSMYGSMTVFSGGKQVESNISVGNTHSAVASVGIMHRWEFDLHQQKASNNIAEVLMVHIAVQYLCTLIHRMTDKGQAMPTTLTVLSDSEWALGVATHQYKAKPDTLSVLGDELGKIDAAVEWLKTKGVTLNFTHVNNLWVKSVLGH